MTKRLWLLLLLPFALVAYAVASPAGSVLVRNTPKMGWAAGLIPAPSIVRFVEPTAGDSSQTGALYVPNGQGQWPGVLLVNGAEVPGGWRYPDIEKFATSIAELGLTVYVPDLPGFEEGVLSTRALRALKADLGWFTESPYLNVRQASLVGVCVGASLALVAAADADTAGLVRSVVGLDPYSRIRNVLRATTVALAPGLDGQIAPFQMENWVRADVARSLTSTIDDAPSREAVQQVLKSSPANDPLQEFRQAPPELSAAAAAWWRLLGNTDPARFDELYNDLPAAVQHELDELSPGGSIDRVRVPVLIAAPYHDFAFPAGEATELQRGNPGYVRLTRTSALDHVTPTLSLSVVRDYWDLWHFASDGIRALRVAV